jgi:hypothetical protein
LIFLKAFKLRMLVKNIERKVGLQGVALGYCELFKLFFFIFFIAHLMVTGGIVLNCRDAAGWWLASIHPDTMGRAG